LSISAPGVVREGVRSVLPVRPDTGAGGVRVALRATTETTDLERRIVHYR